MPFRSPLKVPSGQGVQADAPTAEKYPGGQEVQLLAPGLLNVFSGQVSQDPCVFPLNCPAGQGVHSVAPALE